MTAVPLRRLMPYGAPELLDAARPGLARSLALGSLLATLAFTVAWSLSLMWVPRVAPSLPIAPVFDLQGVKIIAPPPLETSQAPPVAIARPAKAAIPVPVPDAVVLPDGPTIASQQDLGSATGSGAIGANRTEGATMAPPADGPVNHPGTVALVDQLPVAVREVRPEYPDLARQAQVEGLVVVNVLVGRDGRVIDARLHPKVHQPLLDQEALDAARQWVFTPALMGSHPVSVWVTIPFRFTLRN